MVCIRWWGIFYAVAHDVPTYVFEDQIVYKCTSEVIRHFRHYEYNVYTRLVILYAIIRSPVHWLLWYYWFPSPLCHSCPQWNTRNFFSIVRYEAVRRSGRNVHKLHHASGIGRCWGTTGTSSAHARNQPPTQSILGCLSSPTLPASIEIG
jgi:hypothetical protein